MKGRVVAFVLVVLGVIALALWLPRNSSGLESAGPGRASTPIEGETALADGAWESVAEPAVMGSSPATREATGKALPWIRVVNTAGESVGHVYARWTPLDSATLRAARTRNWDAVSEASSASGSNSNEHAAPTPPAGAAEHASVIWLLSPNHAAHPILLGPGEEPDWGSTVAMQAAPSITVRVQTRSGGATVAGAQIVQSARPDGLVGKYGGDSSRARSVFFAEWISNDAGTSPLFPIDGTSVVEARRDLDVATPFIGPLAPEVLLFLDRSFTAAGRVTILPEVEIDEPLWVRVLAWKGHLHRELRRFDIRADGVWGPEEFPHSNSDRIEFRLDGANSAPDRKFFDVPVSGDELWVEQEARAGHTVWALLLSEEDEQPIGGGRVTLTHTNSKQESYTVTRLTNPTGSYVGYAAFDGVPEGHVVLSGTAEGYAHNALRKLAVPADLTSGWEIPLGRGSSIAGRCVIDGQPVSDFEFSFWNKQVWGSASHRQFHDREDGSFLVDDVPVGEVFVMATSLAGRSAISKLNVTPDGIRDLVIEIDEASLLKGRVIDILSGQPIPSATVRMWSSYLGLPIAHWGPPLSVDERGAFEFRSLLPGRNTVEVTADGYTTNLFDAVLTGKELDYGAIPLYATQDLAVQLIGAPEVDYSGYRLDLKGVNPILGIGFDEHGVARVPDAPAGWVQVQVKRPDKGGSVESDIYLVPGREWRLEVPVGGSNSLQIRATADDPSRLQELSAMMSYWNSAGDQTWNTVRLNAEGQALVSGLPPGDLFVYATGTFSATGDLGSALVTIEEGANEVVIPLTDAAHRVQVVDERRRALSTVEVSIDHPRFPGTVRTGVTDTAGLCTVQGLSDGDYFAHLMHPQLGIVVDLPVRLDSAREAPHVLVFETGASLEVQVEGPSGPLQSARCSLGSAEGSAYLSGRITDAAGRARWEDVSAGSYRMRVLHPRVWPGEFTASTGSLEKLRVRGLGSLRFEVLGAKAPGSVQLTCEGVEGSAQDWLELGWIRSSTGSLAFDAQATLLLEGLPEGRCDWVHVESGQVGSATIIADKVSEVPIRLPKLQ